MTDKSRHVKVRKVPTADQNLIAALVHLPPEIMETVWLGALLTARLADDNHPKAAAPSSPRCSISAPAPSTAMLW